MALIPADPLRDRTSVARSSSSKRVLIVGGVERTESLYREFIEGRRRPDYHNGRCRAARASSSGAQARGRHLAP